MQTNFIKTKTMRTKINCEFSTKLFGFLLIALLIISCEKEPNTNLNPTATTTKSGSSTSDSMGVCSDGFWYDWSCYSNDKLSVWGLGSIQTSYVTCDKDYDWYIDQADTGPDSTSNCGPSSVTMACKWYDEDFAYTAEDARNVYPEDGGWWYTSDVTNYLKLRSVPYTTYEYEDADQIVDLLNKGNIMIACLNAGKITYDSVSAHRIDRFYTYSSGHFLVIKGARTVDSQVYIEVYDPNNWHEYYSDGSQKGKNRHYKSDEISTAISKWWNYLIVVSPKSRSLKSTESKYIEVDPDTIEVNYGM
jgi:hypothetical protein